MAAPFDLLLNTFSTRSLEAAGALKIQCPVMLERSSHLLALHMWLSLFKIRHKETRQRSHFADLGIGHAKEDIPLIFTALDRDISKHLHTDISISSCHPASS